MLLRYGRKFFPATQDRKPPRPRKLAREHIEARKGLIRCRQFLKDRAPTAPDIGRPFPEAPVLRELLIALAIPVMWPCIATNQLTMRCMFWPSGTGKRRVIDSGDSGRRRRRIGTTPAKPGCLVGPSSTGNSFEGDGVFELLEDFFGAFAAGIDPPPDIKPLTENRKRG